jgi:hypothetical protein
MFVTNVVPGCGPGFSSVKKDHKKVPKKSPSRKGVFGNLIICNQTLFWTGFSFVLKTLDITILKQVFLCPVISNVLLTDEMLPLGTGSLIYACKGSIASVPKIM